MEDPKSTSDHFFDALDDFPFYDCLDTPQSDHDHEPESLSPIKPNDDVSQTSKPSPEISIQPTDSNKSNPISSLTYEINDPTTSDTTTSTLFPRERKYRFSRNINQNEKLDPVKPRFRSTNIQHGENEVTLEASTLTNTVIDEPSSNFLFLLAALVVKAIAFQINLLVGFFTFPIWLLHCSYVFVVDPFWVVRFSKECLTGVLLRVWGVLFEGVTRFTYEWVKGHKSVWVLGLRFGWGLLWSVYVSFVLVSLLASSFLVGGFMMNFLVDKPVQIKEVLEFDYTKTTPVAYVPIISCPDVSCGVSCKENIQVGKLGEAHVVPLDHKLQVTLSLTLPESDYNRNLGNFQVRVDFLSVHGKTLASLGRPCMLQFKSEPIRLLLTFLKVAPLVAGYSSESQTININFRGYTEEETPTACLRVVVEQRAEFRPGAGIPEIYAASLKLESKLPLLKRILWNWKNTILVWISMMMFTMELLFTLLCCKPFIMPRVRLRGGSANSSATRNNPPSQR